MSSKATRIMPTLALVMSLVAFNRASACGFDGMLGNGFSAMHPKSITVALALRDAIDTGVMEQGSVEPIVEGKAGYWRAVGRLSVLQRRLAIAAVQSPQAISISVLFVESRLWARLTPSSSGFDMQAHTDGAQSGDVVLVTGEAILARTLEGRLSVQAALENGVMAIDGASDAIDEIRRLLVAALDHQSVTSAGPGNQVPATRLFGPKR